MVIKVYSSQATATKQSPFVTNSKLDRNFGQDVFSGIRSIAQGVEAVGEFALQKKQLADDNKKSEAIVKSQEELIQLEAEINKPDGLYSTIDAADIDELFIKKRKEIITNNTIGLSSNLKNATINLFNANTLPDLKRVTNTQSQIILNTALKNKLQSINNSVDNVDFSDALSVTQTLTNLNTDFEFLLNNGMIDAPGFLELRNDSVTKLLNGAFEQLYPTAMTTENYTTADDVDFTDMLELINGDTENDLLTPILGLLDNDDAALSAFFAYQKTSVDAVNIQTNIIEAASANWLNENQIAIRGINSDDLATRSAAFTLIKNAFNKNLITEQVYSAATTKMNNSKGFAIADDPDVIIALNNDFDNNMLDFTDLAGTYTYQTDNGAKEVDINDVLTKETYDNFFTRVSTQQTKSLARANTKLYSSFNIEVGGIDRSDPRHIAISGFLNEAKVDMLNYLEGDFDGLNAKYGQENIAKLGFQKFSNLVIETAKENSVSVRIIAFFEKVQQDIDVLSGDSIFSPAFVGNKGGPDFDVNNFNAWVKSAIEYAATEDNPIVASEIRKSVNYAKMTYNDYREFFDGIQ